MDYYNLIYKTSKELQQSPDKIFIFKDNVWKIENNKLYVWERKWKNRMIVSFNLENLKKLKEII